MLATLDAGPSLSFSGASTPRQSYYYTRGRLAADFCGECLSWHDVYNYMSVINNKLMSCQRILSIARGTSARCLDVWQHGRLVWWNVVECGMWWYVVICGGGMRCYVVIRGGSMWWPHVVI